MKTFEELLQQEAVNHENNYASFPALIENEMALDVYSIILKVLERHEKNIKKFYGIF